MDKQELNECKVQGSSWLWYDMIWYMIWYDTIWYDMIRYDTIRYDMIYVMIWYDMIWYDMIWYMIWYDMIWYDMIWYDIYLLTAIGLPLGGSSTVHIYIQTIHRTTKQQYTQPHKYVGRMGAAPGPCELFPGICLATEEKARKNLR